MEFFDWLTVPQIVISYLSVSVESSAEAASKMLWIQIICVIVAAALYLVGHLCGGFGLMKMAKKQGIKYWWLGFLPFGNTYLTGKLAGETRVFSQKCKRIGLYAMLAEIVYVILQIALLVITFLLTREEFYVEVTTETSHYFEFSLAEVGKLYPESAWIATFFTTLGYIAQIWWFVLLFLMCFLFSAFFRKYYARSPMLMTFLCAILPLRGFVLLAVRNNTPVDYEAYMRRRYEELRRQQYGGQGGYSGGAPYGDNGQGGYNGTPYGGGQGGSNDPFSEFGKGPSGGNGESGGSQVGSDGGSSGGGSNDSPFSDF